MPEYNTTGAPFNLKLNTPGIPLSTLVDDNERIRTINDHAMHDEVYDPSGKKADAFLAENHGMDGYDPADEYQPVKQTDSVLQAIGKLEAGVASSGDMKTGVYDTNGNGKVDGAELADRASEVPWEGVLDRPSVLPNPKQLTVQYNGENAAVYDGSENKLIDITPEAIGAVGSSDLDEVRETADSAKAVADAAMPKAGGKFTGNILAHENEGRAQRLRNIEFGTLKMEHQVTPLSSGRVYLEVEE